MLRARGGIGDADPDYSHQSLNRRFNKNMEQTNPLVLMLQAFYSKQLSKDNGIQFATDKKGFTEPNYLSSLNCSANNNNIL